MFYESFYIDIRGFFSFAYVLYKYLQLLVNKKG